MTTGPGSNEFATATPFTYGDTAAPTSSGALTVEGGEPNISDWGLNRTAWWVFTAPFTETVGLDLIQTPIDRSVPDESVWNYDPVLHVYTGTSLGALTLVHRDDDNSRLSDPEGNSYYGYLTETDFAATAGITYYVRAASYTSSLDMDYVLRLGKRVLTYGPWNVRPDYYVPLDLTAADVWEDEGYVNWWTGYQGFDGDSFITPWPAKPPSGSMEACVDGAVGQAAAATFLDNEGALGIPGSSGASVVLNNKSVNFRPNPIGIGLIADTKTEAGAFVHGFGRRPWRHLLVGAAEALIPWNDPNAWDVDYSHPNPPTIDSTFVVDRWETCWEVNTAEESAPGSLEYTHRAVSGSMDYQVLVGDDFNPEDVTGDYPDRPGRVPWDLTTGVPFAHFDYTGGLEKKDLTVTTTVPGAVQPDGAFCIVMKITGVGDLVAGLSQVYRNEVQTGPSWWLSLDEALWSGEPAVTTVTYWVRDISDWRYVYPTITAGVGDYFIAKPDLTWEQMGLSFAGSAGWFPGPQAVQLL